MMAATFICFHLLHMVELLRVLNMAANSQSVSHQQLRLWSTTQTLDSCGTVSTLSPQVEPFAVQPAT